MLRFLLLTAAALLCGLPRLHAGDIDLVIAAKGQTFVQTNAAAAVINPEVSNRFSIFVLVQASSNSGLAGVIVSNIIIGAQSLEGEIGGLMFSHDESFSTKAELDGNIMAGTYVFHIAATNDSNYVATLVIPADAYSNTPHVANWADAQHVDSFADFTLRWDAFAGGSAKDFVHVSIFDTTGGGGGDNDHVFETPFIGQPGALNGLSNSIVIPAGTLLPGHTYETSLTFVNIPSPDTNAIPGAVVAVGFFKETGFSLTTETNPPQGSIRFASTSLSIDEGNVNLDVTLLRVGGSEGEVSVRLRTANLTATAGADYDAYDQQLSFQPGVVDLTVRIPILDDFLLEGPERFRLGLSNPQGFVGVGLTHDTNATVTILDTETTTAGRLSFSAATYQVVESNITLNVIVRREGGTVGAVGGTIEIFGGTATYDEDYDATPGEVMTFTIADGKNSSTNEIQIFDDVEPEGNETILMRLKNPTGGASLGKIGTNTTTILDDESTLQFEQDRTTNIENQVEVKINVVRTGPTLVAATVNYSAFVPSLTFAPAIDADYATAGADFRPTNGTLHFPPGVTRKSFTVKLLDDLSVEDTEVILLDLSSPTNALLGALDSARLYIKDNDQGGTINFVMTNQNVKESVGEAKIMVIRTGGLASNVTVRLSTVAGTATDGLDYRGFTTNLDFSAKEVKKTIPLSVIQDFLVEDTERLTLILTDVSNNASNGPRTNLTVNIADDDLGGTISFDKLAYSVNESVTNLAIIIKRTGGLASNVTVRLQTADGPLSPATAGSDYTALDTLVTFGPGETRKTNTLHIINDSVADAPAPETIALRLRQFTGGAKPGASNAIVAIIDDESSVSFDSATDSGVENKTAIITVIRGGFLGATSTVEYMFMNGTATNGLDFRGTNGTLTFKPKELLKTITVPLISDPNAEGTPETFTVLLKNATNALLGEITTNTVSINDAPAIGAIPATGTSFMIVNVKGIEGNAYSDSYTSGTALTAPLLGNYEPGFGGGGFHPLNAGQVTLSGRTVTSKNLQFTFLKFNGTGIIPVGDGFSNGGCIYTKITSGGSGGGSGVTFSTGSAGSSGNVTIDIFDLPNDVITGRYDIIAVSDGGTSKARISGSFRVKAAQLLQNGL